MTRVRGELSGEKRKKRSIVLLQLSRRRLELSGVDCLLIRETFFFFCPAHFLRTFLLEAIAQGHSFIDVFKIGSYCRSLESFLSASSLSTGLSILPLGVEYLCDGFAVTSFLGIFMRIQNSNILEFV